MVTTPPSVVRGLNGGMVELSNRRIVDWWNDRMVELSNRQMMEWWCCRIVEQWNGAVAESSNRRIVELTLECVSGSSNVVRNAYVFVLAWRQVKLAIQSMQVLSYLTKDS